MAKRRRAPASTEEPASKGLGARPELFIITGVSGSGKGTVLKTLEDLGYYAVDNLPMALLETFAGLVTRSDQQVSGDLFPFARDSTDVAAVS
jgi:UPF0042 nucleotide-binding protein